MSQRIETKFECYGCLYKLTAAINKPRPFESVISKQKCYVCDSEFFVSFRLGIHSGRPGELVYGFLANGMKLGDKGKELFEQRQKDLKDSKPIPVLKKEGVRK